MPLIRGHHSFDDNFTQIPNAWLRDPNLSFAAKGLLAQLMSHIPGWKISQESLAQQNGVGKDRIRTLLNELIRAGYLDRSDDRERNSMGQVGGYIYTTKDPHTDELQKPTQEKPTQVNPPLKKNILKEEQVKNNERTNARKFEREFLDFYLQYPKKVGRLAAQKAFDKAAKRFGVEVILAGVARFSADPNLPELQYIPAPAVWLNQGRWDDAPYPAKKQTRSTGNDEFLARFIAEHKGENE